MDKLKRLAKMFGYAPHGENYFEADDNADEMVEHIESEITRLRKEIDTYARHQTALIRKLAVRAPRDSLLLADCRIALGLDRATDVNRQAAMKRVLEDIA